MKTFILLIILTAIFATGCRTSELPFETQYVLKPQTGGRDLSISNSTSVRVKKLTLGDRFKTSGVLDEFSITLGSDITLILKCRKLRIVSPMLFQVSSGSKAKVIIEYERLSGKKLLIRSSLGSGSYSIERRKFQKNSK